MQLGADEKYRIKNAIKHKFHACFRYHIKMCGELRITDPFCEKIKTEAKRRGTFDHRYNHTCYPCPCDSIKPQDILAIVTTYLEEGRT